ncbi:hypothetical protein ACHRV6_06475 [Flavobacterium sp. FlaQc-51]|uniref:hypothetical protein n=1 Tax=unclassified Flavobacterium TaxID=196869 RepID=UPI0018E3C340|nr:hypothetical protein [Flavobacterium sp. Leaf82]
MINNNDSIILKPLSPKRCAYLFHCTNISVSVNSSVGNTEDGFTYDLLLASSSFFLRILDNEKAEILGSVLTSAFGATGVSSFFGLSTSTEVVGFSI